MYCGADGGLPRGPGPAPQRRHLRGRLQRDGGRQGHPLPLALRAPPAARSSGSAAVAYIPDGRVIGLSKIPRIVDMYARRLQVQERLTQQIADFLMERLRAARASASSSRPRTSAPAMRGVAKPGMVMTTSAVLGLFRRNDKTRAEFFSHIARPRRRAVTPDCLPSRHDRPTDQGAHRQAGPRRPRPRREGARARACATRASRSSTRAFARHPRWSRRAALQEDVDVVGPLDPVGCAHDAAAADLRAAPRGGPGRRPRDGRRHHPRRRHRRRSRRPASPRSSGRARRIGEVAAFMREHVRRADGVTREPVRRAAAPDPGRGGAGRLTAGRWRAC